MVSVVASMTTAFFNAHLAEYLPEKAGELALFDCRVWQVPTLEEAANTLLWREFDATKNSISMAARHYYPHEALHNPTTTLCTIKLKSPSYQYLTEQCVSEKISFCMTQHDISPNHSLFGYLNLTCRNFLKFRNLL